MTVRRSEILLAAAFFWILALLVVPLPALVLDILLSISITVSLLVLLVAIYTQRPIDFSVFPSLLLMVTLLRLGLNVASTRLILTHGDEGAGAAGNVIRAFGEFTVGGSYVVGMVLFLIFVVINFVVITKGAGRIAEVAARFALDAMPGKQMAVDADLNQGVIGDAEARQRRKELQRESDFFGAMDGASKFVRGDAVAGIVILFVNLLGGLVIGVAQHGLAVQDALRTYALLSVGDGLVSQVPALVVSMAAGVVVSRAAGGAALADELGTQLLMQPRALSGVAVMMGALALTPGLPFVPFALLAAATGALGWYAQRKGVAAPEAETPAPPPVEAEESAVRRALELDDLELEIGYGLIPLVDPERGGELLARIRATRRQLATELGFVVPLVHIRDNLQLEPSDYSVLIRGNPVASGSAPAGRCLALRSGAGTANIPGIETRDPAFGLPALWIQERDRERAAAAGYAVVDAATALATHLAEVVRAHAASLLTRQHVRDLLDELSRRSPKVVEEIVPSVVPVATLHRVLRQLLAERVSIRDLGAILETLAEYAPKVQDADLLTELTRERLSRTVTRPHLDPDGTLRVITLAGGLEEKLRAGVQRNESGAFLAIEPGLIEGFVRELERVVETVRPSEGRGPVLLASATLRSLLRPIVSRIAPRLAVLSPNELPPDVRVVGTAVLGESHAH